MVCVEDVAPLFSGKLEMISPRERILSCAGQYNAASGHLPVVAAMRIQNSRAPERLSSSTSPGTKLHTVVQNKWIYRHFRVEA